MVGHLYIPRSALFYLMLAENQVKVPGNYGAELLERHLTKSTLHVKLTVVHIILVFGVREACSRDKLDPAVYWQ